MEGSGRPYRRLNEGRLVLRVPARASHTFVSKPGWGQAFGFVVGRIRQLAITAPHSARTQGRVGNPSSVRPGFRALTPPDVWHWQSQWHPSGGQGCGSSGGVLPSSWPVRLPLGQARFVGQWYGVTYGRGCLSMIHRIPRPCGRPEPTTTPQ